MIMKKLTQPFYLAIATVVIVSGFSLYKTTYLSVNPYKIRMVEQCTDERGLISVKFAIGKDTAAYDYLTQAEYNRFIKTGNPY